MTAAPAAAALGLRVKSGWAAYAIVQRGSEQPRLLARGRLELCDPAVPESRQPYHADFGTEQRDPRVIERLTALVMRRADESIRALLARSAGDGVSIRAAALVVGSVVDPASIANPHIRAHAAEGRLFRCAAQEALGAGGIPSTIWIEKRLYGDAARAIGDPEASVRRAVNAFGRGLDGGWRADDKAAALGAWLALTQAPL